MRQNLNFNQTKRLSVSSAFCICVTGVLFLPRSRLRQIIDSVEVCLSHCSSRDLLIQTQTSSTSFPATETQETLQTPAMSVV